MSKFIVVLFAFLFPTLLSAQITEYGAFKVVDTELTYQKVFSQDSITAEKLAEFLKTLPNVSNVEIVNNVIQADLTEFVVDYKKFKFPQVAVPAILQTGRYNARITADVKDNKYRIVLKSIQVKGNIGYKNIPSPENLTNYACTNSGTVISREWCKPNTLGLLDQAFADRFLYKASKKDGDW